MKSNIKELLYDYMDSDGEEWKRACLVAIALDIIISSDGDINDKCAIFSSDGSQSKLAMIVDSIESVIEGESRKN